jgi:hypothetical protein
METNSERNTSTFLHLSALLQYFIPFGNFIFPIIIWTSKKDKSEYINYHGKQVLNFQLSIFIYSLVLAMIALPLFIYTIFESVPFYSIINHNDFILTNFNFENIIGSVTIGIIVVLVVILLKVAEFFLIIVAAINASNGEKYKYPLTISFIK